jgi:hypothetical protein
MLPSDAPAIEPLIIHAALLAPEPIPLYLFAEAREKFGKPLASALADDGLDEAVAALLRAPRPRDHRGPAFFDSARGGASELIKPDQVILAVNALLRKCPVPCQ